MGPFGDLRKQVAQDGRLPTSHQRELRREEPAGDVHVRAGGPDLVSHPRQRLRTVDQDRERAADPWCRVAGNPWKPISAEQLARWNAHRRLTHRLMRLPELSRRSERILGPFQGFIVDG